MIYTFYLKLVKIDLGGFLRTLTLALLLFSLSAFAKNILIIGDSHTCGSFGKTLVDDLTKKKNNVTLYCAVSSAPNHWISGNPPSGQVCQTMSSGHLTPENCEIQMPPLSKLLEDNKDALIVVALGTNSLLSPTAGRNYNQFADAVDESGQECVWIGPPHFNESQSKGFPKGRVATLNTNLNPFYISFTGAVSDGCRVIDSRTSTAANGPGYDTVDGVHRTNAAGRHWAAEVGKEILN